MNPSISESVAYWQHALERIKSERISLRHDNPATWKRLEKLAQLEKYANECLRLAREGK